MYVFPLKFKIYCPNLTSTPPCPASMTIVYCAFGELAALTTQQMSTIENLRSLPAFVFV